MDFESQSVLECVQLEWNSETFAMYSLCRMKKKGQILDL